MGAAAPPKAPEHAREARVFASKTHVFASMLSGPGIKNDAFARSIEHISQLLQILPNV